MLYRIIFGLASLGDTAVMVIGIFYPFLKLLEKGRSHGSATWSLPPEMNGVALTQASQHCLVFSIQKRAPNPGRCWHDEVGIWDFALSLEAPCSDYQTVERQGLHLAAIGYARFSHQN
jgi:hypothetical protein